MANASPPAAVICPATSSRSQLVRGGEHDGGAGLGECAGGSGADAVAGPGDDRDLVL
jgi:hypothetical protein